MCFLTAPKPSIVEYPQRSVLRWLPRVATATVWPLAPRNYMELPSNVSPLSVTFTFATLFTGNVTSHCKPSLTGHPC
jgi:hypothetical protein